MTELQLPPVAVDHGPLWLQIDLSTKQDWAWRAAAQLMSRPQWAQYRTQNGEKQLTARMKLLRTAFAGKPRGPMLGFILAPSPEEGIKGMATFSPVELDGQNADEAMADLLQQLAPRLPVGVEPEITRIQTPAGECRRLRTRFAVEDGPEGPAGEQIGYVWNFGESGATCLIMSFASLPEAARWLPALDGLACEVRLQASPAESGLAAPERTAAAGTAGGIEIRPVRPDGKLHPRERTTLANWVLAANPANGTLTLSGDRLFGGRPQVFQLPSTGQPGAVSAICLAAHYWEIGQNCGSTWRMLFLDRENRLVGVSSARDYWRALRLFPQEVLDPLKAIGICVTSEWYDSGQALQDAYQGAARKVALLGESRGRVAAIGLSGALVILIIVFVAVYFSTH